MNIKLNELRQVTEMIFEHLSARGVAEVSINQNMYWKISCDERYNVNVTPAEINVGSLEDDKSDLDRILRGDQDVLAMHLQPLAALLDALGMVLGDTLAPRGG